MSLPCEKGVSMALPQLVFYESLNLFEPFAKVFYLLKKDLVSPRNWKQLHSRVAFVHSTEEINVLAKYEFFNELIWKVGRDGFTHYGVPLTYVKDNLLYNITLAPKHHKAKNLSVIKKDTLYTLVLKSNILAHDLLEASNYILKQVESSEKFQELDNLVRTRITKHVTKHMEKAEPKLCKQLDSLRKLYQQGY